jgi:hypothetical protein
MFVNGQPPRLGMSCFESEAIAIAWRINSLSADMPAKRHGLNSFAASGEDIAMQPAIVSG